MHNERCKCGQQQVEKGEKKKLFYIEAFVLTVSGDKRYQRIVRTKEFII